MYMNYHPTNDFPVNLEDVYSDIGFANKGNAKRTLENNFILNEDYKITILPSEKGQIAREMILLNTDCFKSLCMIAKTPQGKEIRKYYVKLENINHKLINEELEEQKLILEQKLINEKENTVKLLEEKDKKIAELKQEEKIPILYIGHDPVIKNCHKIGINVKTKNKIIENKDIGKTKIIKGRDILKRGKEHKTSSPRFEFLFTYETPHAKLIEDFIILILKPFKVSQPEWFTITYERMKQVVDFAIMMFDNYQINDSVDNVIEFISRYRSNRLINTNKARVLIDKKIYEEFVKENIVKGEGLKVNTEMISNDFYEWYSEKFPEQKDLTHIKLQTGNYSTEFRKEITKIIANITEIEYSNRISLSDRKRGIYFSNCGGFVGLELKSMVKKADFFDKVIYEKYVEEFIEVTDDPRHKIARVEILDDFLV